MIRESGNLNPGQLKRRALSEMHIRFGSSWFHSEPGFQAVKKAFFEAPELFAGGEVIWKTRNKAVRKVTLPGRIRRHHAGFQGLRRHQAAALCAALFENRARSGELPGLHRARHPDGNAAFRRR